MTAKPQDEYVASLFGRIAGGIFCGSVVGLFTAVAFVNIDEPQEYRLKVAGAFVMAGVVVFTMLSVVLGSYNFRGLPKAVLVGMVLGALAGIVVTFGVNACWEAFVHEFKFKGVPARTVSTIVAVGAALGAIVGLVLGLVARRRWK